MLILILHYKNFKEKILTGNELRKAAIGRKNFNEMSEDIDAQQETVLLDFATNKSSEE